MSPKSNFRPARFKLRTTKQETCESVDSFIKRLRVLVQQCEYADPNEHIIDAVIFGSNDKRIQFKLLEHDSALTLDKVIDIARTQEATSHQLHDISGSTTTQVNALKKASYNPRRAMSKTGQETAVCGNCGQKHGPSKKANCPAFGTTCGACGKLNHWKRVCRSSKTNESAGRKTPNKGSSQQTVHTLGTY